MGTDTIYAVYAKHVDRNQLLGFATGDIADIKSYYADREVYGLELVQVRPKHIAKGSAVIRRNLLAKKVILERELEALDRKLGK